MNIILFLFAFLFNILRWDILLRAKKIINYKGVYKFLNTHSKKMASETFKLLRYFTCISFKTDIPDYINLPENFVIICNHQSLVDIPFVFFTLPDHVIKFVAKKSLSKYIPLISICLRTGKHAIINQKRGFQKTKLELLKLSKLARTDNICPLIFPEGTRSKTGKLGKFHSAAFRILCKHSKLPILSIALDGGHYLSHLYNVFNISSNIELKLKILSVHNHPKDKTETDSLLEKIREEIESQLSIWKNNDS